MAAVTAIIAVRDIAANFMWELLVWWWNESKIVLTAKEHGRAKIVTGFVRNAKREPGHNWRRSPANIARFAKPHLASASHGL
jgi:hypothetical protein